VNTIMNLRVHERRINFLTSWVTVSFSRGTLLHEVNYGFMSLSVSKPANILPGYWLTQLNCIT
jgi:hypothetical protein